MCWIISVIFFDFRFAPWIIRNPALKNDQEFGESWSKIWSIYLGNSIKKDFLAPVSSSELNVLSRQGWENDAAQWTNVNFPLLCVELSASYFFDFRFAPWIIRNPALKNDQEFGESWSNMWSIYARCNFMKWSNND